MYLAVCDDKLREITEIPRLCLFETNWVMSAPKRDGDAYTITNASTIKFRPFTGKRAWAASTGLAQEIDGSLFAVVPLEKGWDVRERDTVQLAPGHLTFSVSDIKPNGRKEPEPDPGPLEKTGLPSLFSKMVRSIHRQITERPTTDRR